MKYSIILLVVKYEKRKKIYMELKEIILSQKNEIIDNLSKLVSYKSVLNTPQENAPYGKENAECLKEFLTIARNYGLKTKNLDGHCGYVEIGEGNEIIGIVAHLDIVPEGNGWDTDPFKATIKDNKIYGRGTSDDKGGAIASLSALKIIKDLNIPLTKRIRLIVGCNEETGSNCMKYYVEKEGNIDIGFTPDADFPVIHGEKGIIKATFKCQNTKDFYISGGVVSNAVSDHCKIEIKQEIYNKELVEKYFIENNIEYTISNIDDKDIIEVKGISAHASTPELGKNAISHAIMALENAKYQNELVNFYSKCIKLETNGESLGIECSDEYGNLTCVNGMIWTENDQIIGTIDIRVPVTLNPQDIVDKLATINQENTIIQIENYSEPLFYPADSNLVKTLIKAYQDVTGDKDSKPLTIGGGTYAKTMKNCVAFGCAFPNTDNRIHNSNEFVDINELLLQVEIYINAILGLLNI